eukprot:NODE_4057_length_1942_cov_13.160882.p1 GENE.NODE_4057_length_1942_cov_13.160882~~NODE_4057_length_1942_cov_13.160882.p1  ORF type:complete len:467 (-),score=74.82 NODE_4057_length_1942_cov_13.160882:245-1645(-)
MRADELLELSGVSDPNRRKCKAPGSPRRSLRNLSPRRSQRNLTAWDARWHSTESMFTESGGAAGNSGIAPVHAPRTLKSAEFRQTHDCAGIESIREFCVRELVQNANSESSDELESGPGHTAEPRSLYSVSHLLCCVCGILPFQEGCCSVVYKLLLLSLLTGMLIYSMALTVAPSTEAGLVYQCLSSSACALGGVLGVTYLWLNRIHQLLGPHHRPLEFYAAHYDFIYEWRRVSLRHFVKVCAIWLWMVLGRAITQVGIYDCSLRQIAVTEHIYMFAVATGVVVMTFFCFLHIFCGLELAIDRYCVRFFQAQDVVKGVAEWNILQAILRRAGSTIDTCVLAVGTVIGGLVVVAGVELLSGSITGFADAALFWGSSGLPPMVLAHYTCFAAAAITEKCQRVPPLVNSWDFGGDHLDPTRQYVVRYISDSAAGFYVKGVRMSGLMAMKVAYAFGTVAFALLTKTSFAT